MNYYYYYYYIGFSDKSQGVSAKGISVKNESTVVSIAVTKGNPGARIAFIVKRMEVFPEPFQQVRFQGGGENINVIR